MIKRWLPVRYDRRRTTEVFAEVNARRNVCENAESSSESTMYIVR